MPDAAPAHEGLQLWTDRRKGDCGRLCALIPAQNGVPDSGQEGAPNFFLEQFRLFQNDYYDIFNNGACNFATPREPTNARGGGYAAACARYGVVRLPPRHLADSVSGDDSKVNADLEALGDRVIDAALAEQFMPRQAVIERVRSIREATASGADLHAVEARVVLLWMRFSARLVDVLNWTQSALSPEEVADLLIAYGPRVLDNSLEARDARALAA